MQRLQGHVALVTGGTRGIGRGIALHIAREGAAVGIVGRSKNRNADEVVKEITDMDVQGFAVRADVSVKEQVQSMVLQVKERLGPIDILVNNAGIYDFHYTSAWSLEEEDWDKMCSVNLKGVYLCCAAVLPDMIAARWGRIVNIASTSGISGGTSGIHYAASKGGVIALSKALSREVAAYGVTVNVVAPSKIDTDILKSAVKPEDRSDLIKKIPVGRIGKPEDIAEAVTYFAGDEAGYVTGQTLVVSGGY